jgi:hypothetical protein
MTIFVAIIVPPDEDPPVKDGETKAGARHGKMDMSIINRVHSLARDIQKQMKALGATGRKSTGDEIPEEWFNEWTKGTGNEDKD